MGTVSTLGSFQPGVALAASKLACAQQYLPGVFAAIDSTDTHRLRANKQLA